jgi:hypothetical protein
MIRLSRFFEHHYKIGSETIVFSKMSANDRALAESFADTLHRGDAVLERYKKLDESVRFIKSDDEDPADHDQTRRVTILSNVIALNRDADSVLSLLRASVLTDAPSMTARHGEALAPCSALIMQRDLPPRSTQQAGTEYETEYFPKLYPARLRQMPDAYNDYMTGAYDLSQDLYRVGYSNIESFRPRIDGLAALVPVLERDLAAMEQDIKPHLSALHEMDRDLRHKSILMGLNLEGCANAVQKMMERTGPFSNLPAPAPVQEQEQKSPYRQTSYGRIEYRLK